MPSASPADPPHPAQSAPSRCGSCQATLETPVACGECHAIFPVPEATSHFTRLGIAERFAVDLADAERRFIALSRELHPDFFTTRSPEEQALSLAHAAQLNEAIAVIRDPFKRAAYLLQRWAPQVAVERDQQMPDGFLEEMLFLHEEIDELQAAAPSSQQEVERDRLRAHLTERRDGLLATLADACERVRAARDAGADFAAEATTIRRTLNAARYVIGSLASLREVRH